MSQPSICFHCGRPIFGGSVYGGGVPYHVECAQSPYRNTFQPISEPQLTADQLRQIVREEVGKLLDAQSTKEA